MYGQVSRRLKIYLQSLWARRTGISNQSLNSFFTLSALYSWFAFVSELMKKALVLYFVN